MIIGVRYGVPHNDQGLDDATEEQVAHVAQEHARLLEEWCRAQWPEAIVDWHYYYTIGVVSHGDQFHAVSDLDDACWREQDEASVAFDDAAQRLWTQAIEIVLQ